MILSAQRLSHFGVQEGNEREGPKGFGDKDVRHFSKLAEIVAQVVGGDIFGAAADKDFAGNLWASSLFFQIVN